LQINVFLENTYFDASNVLDLKNPQWLPNLTEVNIFQTFFSQKAENWDEELAVWLKRAFEEF